MGGECALDYDLVVVLLDVDREIADPAGHPYEVVIGADGAIDSRMATGPFPYSA